MRAGQNEGDRGDTLRDEVAQLPTPEAQHATPCGAPTDVLVVHASKHGGTAGLAAILADGLREHGLTVDVRPAEALISAESGHVLDAYGTVVLGSGVYLRRWRPAAVHFLHRHATRLRARRVWLFQSGPCGPDAAAAATAGIPVPGKVQRLAAVIGTEPVVTFGGRIDPAERYGVWGRYLARTDLAGDWRDPQRIRAWAAEIAGSARTAADGTADTGVR